MKKVLIIFCIVLGGFLVSSELKLMEVKALCCEDGCGPCDFYPDEDVPDCVGNSCDCPIGAACHDGDGTIGGHSGCYTDWFPMIGARIYYDTNRNGLFDISDIERVGGGEQDQSGPPPIYAPISPAITPDCYVETSNTASWCNRSSDDYYTRPSWYNPPEGACRRVINGLEVDLNYNECRSAYTDALGIRHYSNCQSSYTRHVENYPDSCYTRFPAFNQGTIDWDGGMISGYVQPLTVFTQVGDPGAFLELRNTWYDVDVDLRGEDSAGYEIINKRYCINGICTSEQAWGCPWTVVDILIGDAPDTCSITASATGTINEGGTGTLTVSNNSSDVNDVRLNYITPNDGVISIQGLTGNYTPITGTNTYQINAGQVPANQTYSITVRGRTPDGTTCDATTNSIIVQDSTVPWWQVSSADVWTNGDLRDTIPATTWFNLLGSDGSHPGVNTYGFLNATQYITDIPSASLAQDATKRWISKSGSFYSNFANQYSYNYFERRLPSNVEEEFNNGGVGTYSGSSTSPAVLLSNAYTSGGYSWVKHTGSALTISSGNLGSNKLIVLSEGDINISGNVTFTQGQGLFMLVTSGDTTVGTSVTSLMGVFVNDGNFNTCPSSGCTDIANRLTVTGSVTAWDGVNLNRDTQTYTNPSETFVYSPSMIFSIPFTHKKIDWREVAP